MSENEPREDSPESTPPRLTFARRAARLALPLTLFTMAWLMLAGLPNMTDMAVSQVTFEERCPDEFTSARDALDNSGLLSSPITTLLPLGHSGSDGSTYVKANASCELEYVSTGTTMSSTEAREALTASGWVIADGPPGAMRAEKNVNGTDYVLTVSVDDEQDLTAVTLRPAN